MADETIADIVHAHSVPLLRAALGLGVRRNEAEELVQATFAAFLDAKSRFERKSSVRTYLFGILYNKALEHGRRQARELATDPGDQIFESWFNASGHWIAPPSGPERDAEVAEIAELIDACLSALPAQQRAAFQLKEVDRQSADEACNVLGVQSTHLRVLLFRARNSLRACIEKKWMTS
jgi:RNA polymerase sigma-70 factor, ECF subfamily